MLDERATARAAGAPETPLVPGLRVLAVTPEACEVALGPDALRDGLASLRRRLPELLSGPRRSLVVEVSALTSLSSSAIAVLLLAERRCRARGGRLVVRGAGRRCRRLLEVTGLDDGAGAHDPGTTKEDG